MTQKEKGKGDRAEVPLVAVRGAAPLCWEKLSALCAVFPQEDQGQLSPADSDFPQRQKENGSVCSIVNSWDFLSFKRTFILGGDSCNFSVSLWKYYTIITDRRETEVSVREGICSRGVSPALWLCRKLEGLVCDTRRGKIHAAERNLLLWRGFGIWNVLFSNKSYPKKGLQAWPACRDLGSDSEVLLGGLEAFGQDPDKGVRGQRPTAWGLMPKPYHLGSGTRTLISGGWDARGKGQEK